MELNIEQKCLICGKPLKYVGGPKKYLKTCGNPDCSKELNRRNRTATCLRKYGVDNPAKDTKIKERIKQTNIERYGYISSLQNDEIKEKTKRTNIEKYGNECAQKSELVKDKIRTSNRSTCLSKYGVDHIMKVPEIRERAVNNQRASMLSKYGCEYAIQVPEISEHIKNTCLERYGVDHPMKSDIVKEKQRGSFIEKYGVDHPWKLHDVREKMKRTWGDDSPWKSDIVKALIQKRGNETKRKNGTFNKSKDEDLIYEKLCDKYGKENVVRQYSSELYPFKCDFYIITEDLYIEYNGSQYHCGHPFDKKDDKKKLDELKQKAKDSPRHLLGKESQYDKMIYVWTDLDVRKRNIAKENNLNFIEVWDKDYF